MEFIRPGSRRCRYRPKKKPTYIEPVSGALLAGIFVVARHARTMVVVGCRDGKTAAALERAWQLVFINSINYCRSLFPGGCRQNEIEQASDIQFVSIEVFLESV